MRSLEATRHYTSGARFTLRYYTTSVESRLEKGGTLYGVRIEKYVFTDDKDLLMEENECPGVTYDHEEAKRLAGLLARSLVTPITLDCVLDEMHG